MKFEEMLRQLEARGVLLDHLGQTNNGKLWSANVRRKGTTNDGWGTAKDIEGAIRDALKNSRDRFDPAPRVKKRKRTRL